MKISCGTRKREEKRQRRRQRANGKQTLEASRALEARKQSGMLTDLKFKKLIVIIIFMLLVKCALSRFLFDKIFTRFIGGSCFTASRQLPGSSALKCLRCLACSTSTSLRPQCLKAQN